MSNRIREALDERGWTQKRLAAETGLAESQISRLMNGGDCHTKTARKLARALDATLDDLFGPSESEAA